MRRKPIWTVSILAAAAATAAVAYGASSAPASRFRATSGTRTVLRVTTDPTYKPLAFMQNGKLKGFDIDIAHALAKTMHVKLQLVPMQFDGIIPALQANKVDTEPEMAYTAQRAQVVNYTVPYFYETEDAVLRASDKRNPTVSQLRHMKVGVTAGSAAVTLAQQDHLHVTQYNTTPASFQDLILGRIDAVVIDSMTAGYSVQHIYPGKLRLSKHNLTGKIPIAGIVNKGNPWLLIAMNEAIRDLKHNGKMRRITEKWFGLAP